VYCMLANSSTERLVILAKVMGSIHVRSSLWVFILWVWGSGPVSKRVYCNVSPICVKATVSNN